MKGLIQIAGIIDLKEAEMLMNSGTHYLGFPLRLPVNKEDLSEEEAAEVIKHIHAPHSSVLITYLDTADEISEFCNMLGVQIVQLHGSISRDELIKLKTIQPGFEIIKSLVVHENNFGELADTIDQLSDWVDAYITDTFDPVTGASGATGKIHDWSVSKELVKLSPKPVIIAGGLNPSNVRKAIIEIGPAGVDVHTGVEDKSGRKDPELVRLFIEEAKLGFASLK